MLNQTLKKKIFKIIPEHSFLMKLLKKPYRLFLILQFFLFLLYEKFLVFLFEIRSSILPQKPIKVKVKDNISFKLVPKGQGAMHYWSGLRFERQEIEFIINQIKPGMLFLDIGSNVGLYSLAVASKYKDVKTYAFEPCCETFDILQKNIHINKLDNVTLIRTALGDYEGEVDLNINKKWEDGMNTIGQPTHPSCKVISQEKVPITTLDVFLKSNNISQVHIVKADIEGAELLLFRGAKNLLSRPDAPLIFYENNSLCTEGFGYHPVETMWFLQNFGYLFFILDDKTGKVICRPPREYDAMIIAIKPEHPAYNKIKGNKL